MKVLVTGPDGVLGSNLVRELLRREYKVSVLLLEGTQAKTLESLPITQYYGNILKPESLDACMIDQDAVIHCAASTSIYPARDKMVRRVNIEGSRNVVAACIKHDIKRLVYTGTANSFGRGMSKETPGVETNSYTAHSYGVDYMDSKKEAQDHVLKAVKEQGLPAVIVNPTFMIGPYDSRPSSGAMILGVYEGKVPGYTSGGRNYIAVKDAATAIANALTMGRVGECYILGNENLDYKEAFEKIAAAVGVKAPRIYMADAIVKSYGRINSFLGGLFGFKPAVTKEMTMISCDNHYYSSAKAQDELKLPQTPIDQAFQECFEWFKANGYLKK